MVFGIIAIVLADRYTSDNSLSQAVVLGLATGVLAAAVFALFQHSIAAASAEHVLRETINGAITTGLHSQIQRFMPSDEYPEQSTPNPRLNAALTSSLSGTNTYTFHGLTGSMVGIRLHNLNRQIGQITVVIADPTTRAAVDIRIAQQRFEGHSLNREQAAADLENCIDACLIGLFCCRARHGRIEVYFTSTPSLDRSEITDEAAFVSLFSAREDPTKKYPPTFRWSRAALMYRAATNEADHLVGVTDKRLRLTAASSEQDLIDFYSTQLDRSITAAEHIKDWRHRFLEDAERMRGPLRGES